MNVHFEDQDSVLILDDITVGQAKVIKVHRQLSMKAFTEGLQELDPDAMVAAYWLMQVQSGRSCNIDTVDFPLVKFASALGDAALAEKAALDAAENEDPKDGSVSE